VACLGAVFALTPAAMADPVTVISRSADQAGTANAASQGLSWDLNGRFAIFSSAASNLVSGQNTVGGAGIFNLFLYDRLSGTTKLVNHVPGSPTIGASSGAVSPAISADGNWVVYGSLATNLVGGQVDSNAAQDVFLWDRLADTTLLVTHAAGSAVTAAAGISTSALQGLSSDGGYVTFHSTASNLVAGQLSNGFAQIFQFDRVSGLSVMVSHTAGTVGTAGNAPSESPSISADGRWVVFASRAISLVAGLSDFNGNSFDVFLWDRDASFKSSTRLISRKAGFPATTGDSTSDKASISADGTGIAFNSFATDLEGVTSDTNGHADTFHYERPTDSLRLVSHKFRLFGIPTETGDGFVLFQPSLSNDGDTVAFVSGSTNHIFQQDDPNGQTDVFLWDAGGITLASHVPGVANGLRTGDSLSRRAIVAGDGSGVAFSSQATNLVDGVTDSINTDDVFFFRRDSGVVSLVSHGADELQAAGVGPFGSSPDSVALDGKLVGFSSDSSLITAGDSNGVSDVFFHAPGNQLFTDGFESGGLSPWSLAVP
jgi:Tol biopolymer transport system component